ncbi:hypothetical protein [Chloroherpeton thalassium]|uniref:hypothetical protein n=1 Tax=Chloroherpeton thalassium TaxID=100716 RepID=UPI000324BFBA|nr:hypothetical protein [Chloroherpeton thalassium]
MTNTNVTHPTGRVDASPKGSVWRDSFPPSGSGTFAPFVSAQSENDIMISTHPKNAIKNTQTFTFPESLRSSC